MVVCGGVKERGHGQSVLECAFAVLNSNAKGTHLGLVALEPKDALLLWKVPNHETTVLLRGEERVGWSQHRKMKTRSCKPTAVKLWLGNDANRRAMASSSASSPFLLT